MRRGTIGLVLAAGAALAACSNARQPEVEANIVPREYQSEMLQTLRTTLDLPTNIKEAAISDPVLRSAGSDQRYSVCVRANWRDAGGNYLGVKEKIAWFYGGHLNQLVDANPGQCAGAAYRPWPELEKLCQAAKCV